MATAEARPERDTDDLAAAEGLRRGARLSEAMALCQNVLGQRPNDPRALLLAATICRDSRQYTAALSHLERLVSARPTDASLLCDVARLHRQCGSKSGAVDAYRMALSADPASVPAHHDLAELHAAGGQTGDAIYHLEVAIALDPDRLDARARLAALLEDRGEGGEAAALRRETMRRARRRIEQLHTRIRTPGTAAAPRTQQRLRLSWAHALLVFGMAGIGAAKHEEESGEAEKAVDTYRETLVVLREAADQARSVAGLRQAFATASLAYSQCHAELARLHERRGETGHAMVHLEESLRVHGGPAPETYAELGRLVAAAGMPIAALRRLIDAARGEGALPAAYPVTRWNLAQSAARWIAGMGALPDLRGDTAGCRIAMIATRPEDIQVSIAVACVFVARGHRVDMLWWPGLRFEGADGPAPVFDRWDERLMALEMEEFARTDLPGGLKLIDMRDLAGTATDEAMEAEAVRLAELDAVQQRPYRLIAGESGTAEAARERRVQRNLHAIARVSAYLEAAAPHHLVVLNGDAMEGGCAYWAARQAGCPVMTWLRCAEKAAAIVVARNGSRSSASYHTMWRRNEPHRLSPERRQRMLTWLSSRAGGEFHLIEPRKRHTPKPQSFDVLADHRLDAIRPVVVLFGDRAADAGREDSVGAFADSQSWILRNIDFFSLHPGWQLIIRLYPQDGPSGVRTALRARQSDLPRNVSLVESSDAKLDYRLLEVAQLGLYRANPIGLELAMMGVIAVGAGGNYFSGMGFTRDAQDETDYFRMVRRALENPDAVAMTDREIELAWCFADLCMHTAPKPFPWSERNFWSDITENWPLERVLGEEGRARFGDTFALLAGEVECADGVVGECG